MIRSVELQEKHISYEDRLNIVNEVLSEFDASPKSPVSNSQPDSEVTITFIDLSKKPNPKPTIADCLRKSDVKVTIDNIVNSYNTLLEENELCWDLFSEENE